MQKQEFENTMKLIEKDEMGLAELFRKFYKNKILCSDLKRGGGYVYNKETCLYEKLCENAMIGIIGETLQKKINEMITYVEANMKNIESCEFIDDDKKEGVIKSEHKKINNLKQQIAKCGKTVTQKNIYHQLLIHYHNPIEASKMNSNSNMLAIRVKKVICLKTGKIFPRTDEHYFTSEMNQEYLGYGLDKTPRTKLFFEQLSANDKAVYEYIRMVMGASITPDVKMKCFFILWGELGNNGKSTLMKIMQGNFGDQYTAITPDFLFQENVDRVDSRSYHALVGKTIAVCSEPQLKYVNGEMLKMLTGDDSVIVKKLFEDEYSYLPKAKIFVLVNKFLHIKDSKEKHVYKRCRVIPFLAEFCSHPDPANPKQFKGDADIDSKFIHNQEWRNDFFTFIVNASIDYFSHGELRNEALKQPFELEKYKKEYFDNMDNYSKFLKDICVFEKNARLTRSILGNRYENYLVDQGQEVTKNAKKFLYDYMANHFICKKFHGMDSYRGIRLKTDTEIFDDNDIDDENDKPVVVADDKDALIKQLQEQLVQAKNEIAQLKQEIRIPTPKYTCEEGLELIRLIEQGFEQRRNKKSTNKLMVAMAQDRERYESEVAKKSMDLSNEVQPVKSHTGRISFKSFI